MDDNSFGELLLERIKSAKTSRAGLGRTIGVHRTTVSDYVSGKYLPTEETFHRIHQVFPDKELYEAYFEAIGKPTTSNRPRCMISNAKPYNYYKAETEELVSSNAKDTSDTEYIKRALRFTITHLKLNGLDILAPNDYEKYVSIYNKYNGGN